MDESNLNKCLEISDTLYKIANNISKIQNTMNDCLILLDGLRKDIVKMGSIFEKMADLKKRER